MPEENTKIFRLSVGYLLLLAVSAIIAGWLAPFPQDAGNVMHFETRLLVPSIHHLFGTDSLGRDIFSLVLFGARLSLLAAIGVVGIALLIGMPLGLVAGFKGRLADDLIMRTCDVFFGLSAIVITSHIGRGPGP